MSTIAELLIKLSMDDAGLDKGMSGSQSKLNSWGASLRSVGTKLTAGVTLPLAAAGAAALNWASDQQEAANKVDVVFGNSAQGVKDWAESTSGSLLLSTGDAMEAAGTFGNLFTSMGMGQEDAAGLSTELVELAQDLSSFNNVPTDQALVALRAALVGEYEPMRALGVQLSQATVEQKALEMGIWDGNGALTAQQRVLATNALIMEQTTNAQGDAARTANSFANRLRILKANLRDAGAELGMRLLPYAERFLGFLLDLLDRFDALDPKWQTAILAIAAFAAALGPVLIAIGMMLPALGLLGTVIGFLVSPIGLVVVALAALIGLGIYAFINDLWGVRDAVYAVIDALSVFKPMLGDLYDAFQALKEGDYDEFFYELRDAFVSFAQGLFELQGIVLEALGGLLAALIGWAADYDWYSLLNSVGQYLWDGLVAGFEYAWPIVSDWLAGLGEKVSAAITSASDWTLTLLQSGADLILGLLNGISLAWPFITTWATGLGLAFVTAVGDLTTTLLQKGLDLLTGLLDGMIQRLPTLQAWLALMGAVALAAVGDVTKSLWQKGVDLISGVIDGFNDRWEQAKYWLSLVWSYSRAAVGDVTSTLKQKGIDLIQGLINGLNDRFETAKAWLSLVGPFASSAVGYLGGILYDAGSALMNGLWDGAKAVWDSLSGWLSEKKAEIAALKGPVREDAKVLIENGRAIMQGFGVGLSTGWDGIERQLSGYTSDLSGAMNGYINADGTGTGNQPNIIVIQTLEPDRWARALADIDDAVGFARGFGSELGLYTGQP